VQRQFYGKPPSIPGFEIAAGAFPAHETGGDYFDFIPMPRGLAIAVGDVEGHGFGSALVMALTRAYLRSFATMGLELEQILTQVNSMLVQDLGSECFVTLALAYLDVSNRSLTYASAGHVPTYLFDESGESEITLESTGLPLGLFPDIEFARRPPIPLRAGHIVLLLTDGITESAALDGTEFGANRAIQYVRDHRQDSASRLVHGLHHAARAFGSDDPQSDDITSVVLKVGQNEERGQEFDRVRVDSHLGIAPLGLIISSTACQSPAASFCATAPKPSWARLWSLHLWLVQPAAALWGHVPNVSWLSFSAAGRMDSTSSFPTASRPTMPCGRPSAFRAVL
jgi:hypothetical protein